MRSSGRSCAACQRPWVRSSMGSASRLSHDQRSTCDQREARTRPGAGRFWYVAASSIAAGKAKRSGSASPQAAGCVRWCSASAKTSRSGGTSGEPRRGRRCLAFWVGQYVDEYVLSYQTCHRTKAEQ